MSITKIWLRMVKGAFWNSSNTCFKAAICNVVVLPSAVVVVVYDLSAASLGLEGLGLASKKHRHSGFRVYLTNKIEQ